MKHLPLLLLFLLTLPASAQKVEPPHRVVNPTGAPVQITMFAAEVSTTETWLRLDVRLTNRSAVPAVAARIRFYEFSAFNEYMGAYTASVVVGGKTEPLLPGQTWINTWRPIGDFQPTSGYHSSVAVVTDVRLSDGTVWHADEEEILDALRRIYGDVPSEEERERVGETRII